MMRNVLSLRGCLRARGTSQIATAMMLSPRFISRSLPRLQDERDKSNEDSGLMMPGSERTETNSSDRSSGEEALQSLLSPDFASTSSNASDSSRSNKSPKDEKSQKKEEEKNENLKAWTDIMSTLRGSGPGGSNLPGTGLAESIRMHTPSSNEPLDPKESFEQQWKVRQTSGPLTPAKPRDGRSTEVRNEADVPRGYGALTSIISRNNVKYELKLGDRYEKPNQLRRRLKSERHRRRFAEAVREKVRLVMELKSRGV